MAMTRAENLQQIRNVLIAGHLTVDQLGVFYREELRKVRGEDFVTEFARDLKEDASVPEPPLLSSISFGASGCRKVDGALAARAPADG